VHAIRFRRKTTAATNRNCFVRTNNKQMSYIRRRHVPWGGEAQLFPYAQHLFSQNQLPLTISSSSLSSSQIARLPREGNNDVPSSVVYRLQTSADENRQTYAAEWQPTSHEPAVPRGFLISSDQLVGRNLGNTAYEPQTTLLYQNRPYLYPPNPMYR
jgi:hypothetical protein